MKPIKMAMFAMVAATGCKTTTAQVKEDEAPAAARADDGGAESVAAKPAAAAAETPPAPAEAVAPTPPPCEPRGKVHFDFDSDYLRPEAREALAAMADCLVRTDAPAALTVAGHADERGTEEYNLALGQRRADAVRRYLSQLGVSAERMRTLTFGEERPADPGHDEAAWSKNRRAEVE